MSTRDRAIGALYGLAIGDALGMPTQLMSRDAVRARYGRLSGFVPAAPEHPLAHGLVAGSITDDTEQALVLAKALVDGRGHIDAADFARRLVAWEDGMRARGSLDLLGPSTKRAVESVMRGESVEQSGRFGTTNGAAMRIAPVGIAVAPQPLVRVVDRVVEASSVTHNTGVAIAGAAAVAAAISIGIEGGSLAEAFAAAISAAELGAARGEWVAAGNVARRIELAVSLANSSDAESSLTNIYDVIGTSLATQESVPAAFGLLALYPDDPWQACLSAASLGGDSDTVAAMAGAIAGAVHGAEAWPGDARRTVARVNSLLLESVADELLALR